MVRRTWSYMTMNRRCSRPAQSAQPVQFRSQSVIFCRHAHIESSGTLLISDENNAYRNAGRGYKHSVIHHALKFVKGNVHGNNVESFWALVKRAWFDTHHHYCNKHLPLFLSESCWKYNHRDYMATVDAFAGGIVGGS